MKTYRNYMDSGSYGENPKSLGREEYLGKNKRRTGLGEENYRSLSSSPSQEKEKPSGTSPRSTENLERTYVQQVDTPGNARTDHNYFKTDFKVAPPMYGEDYSDELYGMRSKYE